ncbi:Na+/H+ antiporter subunit B [Oceanimonas sp. NS1]|uniref:Na(+)/H(+) antiporter subunit B n=1 Tax=Oceanimonas doudoroffii TaxID=84158 RepID=A0A233RE50_9GAMM|nr:MULTISPECIES: Na+/H+ antiporter subunit B [Oceanimonas]MCT7654631.1 Na+/H+ antiporter subunit B [Oceanimonas sp. NS1]NHH99202.1 Na(+)/H(+) antiporter subunit B [Oceanimonas sp. MB9]OXY81652.1 Na(+)/H(+) antiporter subunit B [Oceanimonas doudoroffii]
MISGSSLILQTATRFLVPLLFLFSVFLLLRGHNEPGGGFIAGLVASGAFALHLFAFDAGSTRKLMGVESQLLMGCGLLLALVSGTVGMVFNGQPFLSSQWWSLYVPGLGELKLSTPLFFDIGVFLVVVGVVTTIMLSLAKVEE